MGWRECKGDRRTQGGRNWIHDKTFQSFDMKSWRGGRSAGEVLYECCRCAGLQWEPCKGQTFRRSLKAQKFNCRKDTQLSPIATCWPAYHDQDMMKLALLEMRPWWPPLQHYHSGKMVGYYTYTAELYMWTGFGTAFLRRESCFTTHILLYPLWQTYFPSFPWCNL